MYHKLIVSLLLLLPVFGMAQASSNWQLYLNKTKLLSASLDSAAASYQLSEDSKGKLIILFAKRDTAYKRTLIIMNKQRNTLLEKAMNTSCRKASISVPDLFAKTSGEPFTIYIADLPADPAKAMLVRMAPVAICHVEWVGKLSK